MAKFKQEMPPSGGYAPIIYKRIPPNKGLGALSKFGILFGTSVVGWYILLKTKDELNNRKIELRCANQAIKPMLYAEFDRMFLKQLRKNRDDEERIMKDVEGWEVGKWKGSRVYITLDPDEFFRPYVSEYYAHTDSKELNFVNDIIHNY